MLKPKELLQIISGVFLAIIGYIVGWFAFIDRDKTNKKEK